MTTLLVVDDNEDIRLLFRYWLSHAGFDVEEVTGGHEALALLSQGMIPSLIILDIQMPVMDGWETLRAIRSSRATVDLPVLLCTVKGRSLDTVHGWELGCDGYISKPFDTGAMLEAIRDVLDRTPEERQQARASGLADARAQLALTEGR
ncbi:MAG TPA: response regulator [Actinomycetota bacterium]